MQGSLSLRALVFNIFLQLAETASAAVVTTSPQLIQPQQNLTLNASHLPEIPLTEAAVVWSIDSIHSLTFKKYTSASPGLAERDYFAALISAQTAVFAAYLGSAGLRPQEDEVDYAFYGVHIKIDNYDLELTYAVVSKVLGAVGAFLQRWKKCEADWTLFQKGKMGTSERVISVGSIRREAKV